MWMTKHYVTPQYPQESIDGHMCRMKGYVNGRRLPVCEERKGYMH